MKFDHIVYYPVLALSLDGQVLFEGIALSLLDAKSLMVDLWLTPGAEVVAIQKLDLQYPEGQQTPTRKLRYHTVSETLGDGNWMVKELGPAKVSE